MNLDLCNPLAYVKIEEIPVEIAENDEILLCFCLDSAQNRSFEPDSGSFLASMLFAGRKAGEKDRPQGEKIFLPAGSYFFVQRRGPASPTNRADWLDLALEQQKDGLWERQKLGNLLYVRFLHEDGSPVTQLFRPIS